MMKSCTAPCEDGAEQNPKGTGQIAELRGQGGPDERTGPGDSGKVVAEQDPFVRRLKIVPVIEAFGGSSAAVVQCHDLRRDKFRVEAKTEYKSGGGSSDQPETIDGLAARSGNEADGDRSEDADERPNQSGEVTTHRSQEDAAAAISEASKATTRAPMQVVATARLSNDPAWESRRI